MNHEQQAMKLFDTAESIARAYSYAERSTLHAPRSSGIALVMVLGILSVMVIMAVAFAISMRTERVAAGNYADSVRARQLVHVGLARALDDLAGKLGTNGLRSAGGLVYPPWTVTNSYTNTYTNTSTNVSLLKLLTLDRANEATNFVPRALWAAATNQDAIDAANHWLPVESLIYTNYPTIGPPVESNRMGRVKYLILNCSGLLDANFAGGATRGVGTNPMEIAISQLGEVPNTFTNQRDTTDVRYETLDELAVLNNFHPTNFCVYSHCPPGYWATNWGCAATQVNLSGTEVDMPDGSERWRAITNAFYLAGFDGSEAGVLYRNLVDYIDADSVPTNLMSKCVEAVPMINEVAISNRIEQIDPPTVPPTYRSIAEVDIEWWYPFVQSDGAAYQLQCTAASFTPVAPLVPLSPLPPFPVSFTPGINDMGIIHMPLVSSLPANNDSVVFTATLSFDILRDGVPVDRVNGISIVSACGPGATVSWTNRECIDPRFNAYLEQWTNVPGASAHSLKETNACTINWWQDNPDFDTNSAMYVANTNLHSVGELGYLAYAPWKTVKLYGPNLNPVLDYFAIGTNATDVYVTHPRRGLVNPNSRESNALAAAFADMPADEYPGGPSNRLTMAEARNFAANIFAGGLFTNLSDVGRNLDETSFPLAATELERESYFRNAFNLLNVRQNLFTIIIEAHVASGGNIPRNPVKQRAVALVWRDPYTGEMFVRSIKWLRD